MFEEEVIIDEQRKIIKISVKIKKRQLSIEKKKVYTLNPERLIPEKFKNKYFLKSSPDHEISNCDYLHHSNHGEFIFQLKEDPSKQKNNNKKPTRSRARKAQSARSKS